MLSHQMSIFNQDHGNSAVFECHLSPFCREALVAVRRYLTWIVPETEALQLTTRCRGTYLSRSQYSTWPAMAQAFDDTQMKSSASTEMEAVSKPNQ